MRLAPRIVGFVLACPTVFLYAQAYKSFADDVVPSAREDSDGVKTGVIDDQIREALDSEVNGLRIGVRRVIERAGDKPSPDATCLGATTKEPRGKGRSDAKRVVAPSIDSDLELVKQLKRHLKRARKKGTVIKVDDEFRRQLRVIGIDVDVERIKSGPRPEVDSKGGDVKPETRPDVDHEAVAKWVSTEAMKKIGDPCKHVRDQWLQLHEENPGSATANLVIDPREHAMWIEQDGKIYRPDTAVAELPTGMHWCAMHVTYAGITELSFPIRILRPRPSPAAGRCLESIMLFGKSYDRSMHMFVVNEGRGFSVGFGLGGTEPHKGTVSRHQRPSGDHELRQSTKQMLAAQSPKPRPYTDHINTRWLKFDVVGAADPSNQVHKASDDECCDLDTLLGSYFEDQSGLWPQERYDLEAPESLRRFLKSRGVDLPTETVIDEGTHR